MNKNVTFSLPAQLTQQLHSVVGKRGLSKFVAQALKKALDEKIDSLKSAYRAAENDPDRLELIKDWESLDGEGWE